jgi:hypothetical protein
LHPRYKYNYASATIHPAIPAAVLEHPRRLLTTDHSHTDTGIVPESMLRLEELVLSCCGKNVAPGIFSQNLSS